MGRKFVHPESNSDSAGSWDEGHGAVLTDATPEGYEAWEHSARETLLHRLPLRASLVSLLGAGLTTISASPVAGTAPLVNVDGLCTAVDTPSVAAAMADPACESITVPGQITLDDWLIVVKPLTLQGPTTLARFSALMLSETTTSGGSVGSLHIEDTLTVEDYAHIQVMSDSVTISGTNPSSSRILSTDERPGRAHLIMVCGALVPCEPGPVSPPVIEDIRISDITLDGAEVRPALFINSAGVSIENVAIINGAATNEWVTYSTRAGGIWARNSQIQITASRFENNTGEGGRGAIRADNSNIAISTTSFAMNEAGDGGALSVDSGTVQISSSSFDSNTASRDGGAIHVSDYASLLITNSTFSSNRAGGRGGAIYIDGSALALSHSTVAMNEAAAGAGVFASHNYTATYLRFDDQDGEPILDENGYWQYDVTDVAVSETATVAMSHSLLLGNVAASGVADDFRQLVIGQPDPDPATPPHTPVPVQTVWTHSLVSSAPNVLGGTFTQVRTVESATVFGSNPVLALNAVLDRPTPRTKTLALVDAADNPAIDAGSFTVDSEGRIPPSLPQFDQRGTGFTRIFGPRIDIGAFEVQAASAPTVTETPTPQPEPRPVPPLLPSVIPSLAISDSTLTCTIGEFSDMPSHVDVTLIVGGVRQETRRIAMPATTVTWPVDSLWRGQSAGCEVVARVENRVATAFAPSITIAAAATPTPTPTPTPSPTPTPTPTPRPTPPPTPTTTRAGAAVLFAPLSSALDAADRRALASFVERSGTDATFRVTGFVQGTRVTTNDRSLSAARARAVAAELRRLGVPAANITTVAGGRSPLSGADARRVSVTARWSR